MQAKTALKSTQIQARYGNQQGKDSDRETIAPKKMKIEQQPRTDVNRTNFEGNSGCGRLPN
jgi:hypothetical protein